MDSAPFPDRIASLLARLNARAAGAWRVEGDSLRLLAFDAATDMPRAVADGFVEATTAVPLSSRPLGIVAAAVNGVAAVSIAAQLDPDVGSGYWLRAFGALRSVAVPIEVGGRVVAVVSVALATLDSPSDEVAAMLATESAGWFEAD